MLSHFVVCKQMNAIVPVICKQMNVIRFVVCLQINAKYNMNKNSHIFRFFHHPERYFTGVPFTEHTSNIRYLEWVIVVFNEMMLRSAVY